MRLDDERESDNVEDRRGEGGRGGFGVGKGVGIGTVILALAASYFLGIDPSVMLGIFSGGGAPISRASWKATSTAAVRKLVESVAGF